MQNLDAERSVVGALLHGPDAIAGVAGLRAEDFALRRHALVFAAILAAHAADRGTGPIAVGDELQRRGQLDEAGGHGLLLDLLEEAQALAAGAQVEHHARIVADRARARRLCGRAAESAARLRDGDDPDDVAADLRRHLDDSAPALQRRVRSALEVAAERPDPWLVDGLLPLRGLAVLAGAPSTGKSLIALDVVMRAAHGLQFFGRDTRHSSTIYCMGEGRFGARVRAWRQAQPGARFVNGAFVDLVDGVPDLTHPTGVAELRFMIEDAARRHGHGVGLVVIDTLAIATPGADENDAGAIGAVVGALLALSREFDLLVLVLHHVRKGQPGTPRGGSDAVRGSGALVGAADVVLVAGRDGDANALRIEKARDAECGRPLRYGVRGITTGITLENGKPEFAPVVVRADDNAGAAEEARRREEVAGEERLRAVVEAVAGMDGRFAKSKRAIVAKVSGRDTVVYAAIEAAVESGKLLPEGRGFRVPETLPGSAAAGAAPLRGAGSTGSGQQSASDAAGAAPGSTGQHLRSGGAEVEPQNDGLNEVTGKRGRAR